ncbi:low-specificity L-threonine aldolase [Pseudoalteromonas spongiae]|uniref:low-specificity L-threonine aldolase n=1 Tax=Pseudoalteromonas spongiae TaxID=298657 RepID=UPI00110BFAFC|nr:low-specificity L-threonine aldolase [Pseudoalteromonas spongiae]TMO84868.1 low-specificity L-threonine aldolase [Pseudoalteromonas spongiae]
MIDLRSDTVTTPCATMRELMASAPVGDDVFGDDPTVNALQRKAAELTGHEAALFAPSGTQSNLLALMAHCQRGDEYIVGQDAHTYKYEGGGAAVLGSIQPQPIEFEKDGSLSLELVKRKIKPNDHHYARTRLLSIENTVSGKPLPMAYLSDARKFCDEHGLGLHLDGARVFNAAVYHQVAVKEITSKMDSVSICLSKGLGTPLGSVLCGSKEFIHEAHKWRKMLGGGMRQAGIVAAAGLYALENNIDRLVEDHKNAEFLATELSNIDGISVVLQATNMVFLQYKASKPVTEFADALYRQGVNICPGEQIRLVLHKDVTREDCDSVVAAIKNAL